MRSVAGRLAYRIAGASHGQMERAGSGSAGSAAAGRSNRVREIAARHLDELIVPYVYAEARALISPP